MAGALFNLCLTLRTQHATSLQKLEERDYGKEKKKKIGEDYCGLGAMERGCIGPCQPY